MTDQPEDKRGGSCAIFAALALIAVVAAYPLSAGPVDWAVSKGYLSPACLPYMRAIYYPLVWLMQHMEWFNRLALWYMSLWH